MNPTAGSFVVITVTVHLLVILAFAVTLCLDDKKGIRFVKKNVSHQQSKGSALDVLCGTRLGSVTHKNVQLNYN